MRMQRMSLNRAELLNVTFARRLNLSRTAVEYDKARRPYNKLRL